MRFNVPDTDEDKEQLHAILELTDSANRLAEQVLYGRWDNREHYRELLIRTIANVIARGVFSMSELQAALADE